jgi:hypothetical protein
MAENRVAKPRKSDLGDARAANLRANLLKRKAQTRARQELEANPNKEKSK